jgi:succinoglycan biosynthesis transport protein ExoP
MYTATSQLIIDSRRIVPFAGQALVEEMVLDTTIADSQVEVLKSEAVGLAAIESANLVDDPEFTVSSRSTLRSILASIGIARVSKGGENLQREPTERALRHLRDNLAVKRVGRTYVLEVSFRSGDSAKAAKVANAIVHAYIFDQLRSNVTATKQASEWLRDRLAELRNDAMKADEEVQDYITRNNLISAQPGRTLTEQQLGELQAQLIRLRGEVADAKARFDRLTASERAPDSVAMVESLNSPVLTRIREQYVDAQRREAEFVKRYGVNHPAVAETRRESESLREASRDEIRRTAEAFRNEYEVARSRLDALENTLKQTLDATAAGMRAGVSLRILESSAQSYRRIYDAFLQRFADSRQQQSFPRTEARILTTARGGEKSEPKVKLIFAGALLAGLAGGLGLALMRERLDASVKSGRKMEELICAECFGIIPEFSHREGKRRQRAAAHSNAKRPDKSLPSASEVDSKQPDKYLPALGLERHAVHAPFSEFAETLRRIKVAADVSTPGGIVLGVVSTVAGEGKSFIAANLAELLASDGSRTLLIDADFRGLGLTKRIAPDSRSGLVQLLETTATLEELLWTDRGTGMDFLPTGVSTPMANSATVLCSPEMNAFLSAVRTRYRYLIVDLPPLELTVDARAVSHIVDKFLLVTKFGTTSRHLVEGSLRSAEVIRSRLLGGILNRADARAVRRAQLPGYLG